MSWERGMLEWTSVKDIHVCLPPGGLTMRQVVSSFQILPSRYKEAAAKSLQLCSTLRPHRWQPTRLPHPWDSPGKNTGVGCHFLLQCMKVKSESEVAQSCQTLSDPIDCSPPGSSVHGIFQARVLEWGAMAFSEKIWGYICVCVCVYMLSCFSHI